jgi:hypothetical protein
MSDNSFVIVNQRPLAVPETPIVLTSSASSPVQLPVGSYRVVCIGGTAYLRTGAAGVDAQLTGEDAGWPWPDSVPDTITVHATDVDDHLTALGTGKLHICQRT